MDTCQQKINVVIDTYQRFSVWCDRLKGHEEDDTDNSQTHRAIWDGNVPSQDEKLRELRIEWE